MLLLHVNRIRQECGLPPHRIILAGYTGAYPHAVFVRHDFAFEQRFYEQCPDLFCVDEAGGVMPYRPSSQRLKSNLRNMIPEDFDFLQADRSSLLALLSKSAFQEGDVELSVELARMSLWFRPRNIGKSLRLLLDGEIAAGERQDYQDAGVRVIVPKPGKGHRLVPLQAASRVLDPVDFTRGMAEFDHRFGAHGAYTMQADGGARRALIVNHTVWLAPNGQHLGCRVVSEQIEKELASRGIEIAGWANSLEGLNRIIAMDPGLGFDAVVINGEGTLHHGRPRAFEILVMGRTLAGMGKDVHLINAVWEQNPDHFLEPLQHFRSVAVRDQDSARTLSAAGVSAIYAPDLSWSHDLPTAGKACDEGLIGVQDNVLRDASRCLAAVARRTSLPYFVMARHSYEIQQEILEGKDPLRLPKVLELDDFKGMSAWISGRYHGTILALRHRQKVVATASNTSKISRLLDELRMGGAFIEDAQFGSDAEFWDQARRQLDAYPAGWAERVEAFEALARRSSAEMFDRIAG
nr:polysaccharide pyruvyl transferase family protein [Paracoccus salsus]